MVARHAGVLALALAVVAACTSTTASTSPTDNLPTAAASVSTGPATPSPLPQAPLALVVHRSRAATDLSLPTAQAVLAGQVSDWSALGYASSPLRLVAGPRVAASGSAQLDSDASAVEAAQADPNTLALVPAGAATPMVRALRVAGSDPIRQPTTYPITTPGDPAGPVVQITVVGDVMLGRRVGAAMARSADFAAPLRPMAARLAAADVTIGNFEATLSRDGAPTQGGDSFAADPRVAEGLRVAGFDVLSLANNHVGDWGSRALSQTVDRVRAMGITPVGAGADLAAARAGAVVEAHGIRVGVLATDSIGESPAAGPDRPGTNRVNMPPRTGPIDDAAVARVVGDVRALRPQVDLLLVVSHWGTQYTNAPEDSQRILGRALLAAGADLVVGGHPHWVQGVEVVGDRLLVHSLGNFVFDMDFSWQTQEGVVLEAVAWGGRLMGVELVPYVIGPDFAPRVVDPGRGERVLDLLRASSDPPFRSGS